MSSWRGADFDPRAVSTDPVGKASMRIWRRMINLLVLIVRWPWRRFCQALALGVEDYRRSRRPRHIYLIRHGESRGNVNESLYSVIPDHAMELTDLGVRQARAAGRKLHDLIGDDVSVQCFLSPYVRASRTLTEILRAFDTTKVLIREEALLREQEFGNFQDVDRIRQSKIERRRYGRFWYRFDQGESGADVHGRAADFLLTLFRQMDLSQSAQRSKHYIILTHGLFIRLLCMRYMGWTVAQFEQVWNPSNCEIWRLDKQPDGRYYLATAYSAHEDPETGKMEMVESPLHFGPDRGYDIPYSMRRPRSAVYAEQLADEQSASLSF